MEKRYQFEPIAIVESPYKEKFGIPRQAGLVSAAKGRVVMLPPFDRPEAFSGLEKSTHLWLLFVFHGIEGASWRPTVRPPRLGGNKRIGVFASRSGFRPNPIGMSVVKLEGISATAAGVSLSISGLDLMDGTPILDIKPYIPYADMLPDACSEFAASAPDQLLSVRFSDHADDVLAEIDRNGALRNLIAETLSLDPRPAYKGDDDDRVYGMRLGEFDVRWRVEGEGSVLVVDVIA